MVAGIGNQEPADENEKADKNRPQKLGIVKMANAVAKATAAKYRATGQDHGQSEGDQTDKKSQPFLDDVVGFSGVIGLKVLCGPAGEHR